MGYFLYTVEVGDRDPLQVRDELLMSLEKGAIFDLDRIICEDQIRMAVIRADRAEEHGKMIAKVWGIEVSLHLAATHQISEALDLVGISRSTSRIGMIRTVSGDYTEGIDITPPSSNTLKLYNFVTEDPCAEIVTRGVQVVINHQ